MIDVYLDTGDDDYRTDRPVLHAVRLADNRNGWTVPVTTAAELRRFIAEWARNDPNGVWIPENVHEDRDTGTLTYNDGERDHLDVWAIDGTDAQGDLLFALDGWTWSTW
jgi:hypothetical protein